MDYKIFWTDEAIQNLEEIIHYLEHNWTQKEVDNFKLKLSKQINLIAIYPRISPISIFQPRLRKAVLSKQTSIYYEVKNNRIYLSYIFISRKNVKRL